MSLERRMGDFRASSAREATRAEMTGEAVPLPTGQELFAALSKSEQEAKIGAEAAQLVRDGQADLKDFVAHSRQEEQADFITQKPAEQVT